MIGSGHGEPLLEVRGLTAGHAGAPPCVRDVDLIVGAGEVVAIIGPTGSGKSTLLRTLAGAMDPIEGEIRISGRSPRPGPGGGFPEIGFQMQFAERQFFATAVTDEVGFGLRNAGAPADSIEPAVAIALATVGLDGELASRAPWSLSLGEQRRVALASVLVFRPAVLLLDEPTAGLDAAGRRALRASLERAMRDGRGAVVTGHDVAWLLGVADTTYLLSEQTVSQMDVARAEDRERMSAAGCGGPEAWRFFSERTPGFWSEGRWRLEIEEAARRAASDRCP